MTNFTKILNRMHKLLKYSIILMFPFLFLGKAYAGNNDLAELPTIIINGEEYPCVYLSPIFIFPELKFKNKQQEKFYWKTVRDVKKTLPYAKLAAQLMAETDSHLATLTSEKEKKTYLKAKEKELFAQFEKDLKSMTISQGKILIRLVDRECEKTTYEIIKMYKGGFSAVLWQGIARIFGSNLKSEYDEKDKDQIIERVIILVEAGQL